jgi:hypothetical protein
MSHHFSGCPAMVNYFGKRQKHTHFNACHTTSSTIRVSSAPHLNLVNRAKYHRRATSTDGPALNVCGVNCDRWVKGCSYIQ